MLEILFPNQCALCAKAVAQNKVCQKCRLDFVYISNYNICRHCGAPLGFKNKERDLLCGPCVNQNYSFITARSVFLYEGSLRKLLHMFKYNNVYYLGKIFADAMYEHSIGYINDIEVLIPVPLYISKIRARGYNQSAVLCKELSRKTEKKCKLFVLKKIIDTKPQVNIKSFEQRAKNVKNAYTVDQHQEIVDKKIMLIDDVFTSGSTVQECTRVLMNNGAKSVRVLTVARSVYH